MKSTDASPVPAVQTIYLSQASNGSPSRGHAGAARRIQAETGSGVSVVTSDAPLPPDIQDVTVGVLTQVVIDPRPIIVVANRVNLVPLGSQTQLALDPLQVPLNFSQGVTAQLNFPETIVGGIYILQVSFVGTDGTQYNYSANLRVGLNGIIVGNALDPNQLIAQPAAPQGSFSHFGSGESPGCAPSTFQMTSEWTAFRLGRLAAVFMLFGFLLLGLYRSHRSTFKSEIF